MASAFILQVTRPASNAARKPSTALYAFFALRMLYKPGEQLSLILLKLCEPVRLKWSWLPRMLGNLVSDTLLCIVATHILCGSFLFLTFFAVHRTGPISLSLKLDECLVAASG
jgi:hypothetical protein